MGQKKSAEGGAQYRPSHAPSSRDPCSPVQAHNEYGIRGGGQKPCNTAKTGAATLTAPSRAHRGGLPIPEHARINAASNGTEELTRSALQELPVMYISGTRKNELGHVVLNQAACWERGVLRGPDRQSGHTAPPAAPVDCCPGLLRWGLGAARLSGQCGPVGPGPSRITGPAGRVVVPIGWGLRGARLPLGAACWRRGLCRWADRRSGRTAAPLRLPRPLRWAGCCVDWQAVWPRGAGPFGLVAVPADWGAMRSLAASCCGPGARGLGGLRCGLLAALVTAVGAPSVEGRRRTC
ncbi:hypothetical protein NDU88_002551 [Pleurodeles waltl]|uniref:Uncharacterized protein n=1 Tax=Pleurodeles waltl TaxID=8319 RepID=A0AAV7LCT5_PLEWA|nr:hypothetical protein NDU88_002551 [Pleurodeles waltl]